VESVANKGRFVFPDHGSVANLVLHEKNLPILSVLGLHSFCLHEVKSLEMENLLNG